MLACRARPARGPWPCSASAQVRTSAATGAGKAASRAASQVLEDCLRVAAGQALVGEELHGPQRDQAPLVQEPLERAGVPWRLAEICAAGQHGRHRAAGPAQRARRPAAGLPVAGQRVEERPAAGLSAGRPAPGCPGLPPQGPGGAQAALAGAARPGRADRLLPPAPGAGPERMLPAEMPAGLAQSARQPGQVTAVGAGTGDLAGPGITGRAAARPQACDLLAAVRAAPGPGGGPPLAPLAPAGQVDRAELAAARANHNRRVRDSR